MFNNFLHSIETIIICYIISENSIYNPIREGAFLIGSNKDEIMNFVSLEALLYLTKIIFITSLIFFIFNVSIVISVASVI